MGTKGFGDGAGAAGVVEEADFLILLGRDSEPVFPGLQGGGDLVGEGELPGFAVV